MDASWVLRQARRRAGLTQREVALRAGVKQPFVSRIESGRVHPRVDTLDRLLAACGEALEPSARLGLGVDRSAMRELLAMTPGERARLAVAEARNVARVRPRAAQ